MLCYNVLWKAAANVHAFWPSSGWKRAHRRNGGFLITGLNIDVWGCLLYTACDAMEMQISLQVNSVSSHAILLLCTSLYRILLKHKGQQSFTKLYLTPKWIAVRLILFSSVTSSGIEKIHGWFKAGWNPFDFIFFAVLLTGRRHMATAGL